VYGSPEQLVGTVLKDTYRVERVIGEGAYGTVYAARHVDLPRRFAVKVLRLHDRDALSRFRREAEIASDLGSRFIGQVFDFSTMPEGSPYLVMELLDGEDLGQRLARTPQGLPLHQVLRLADQTSQALSVAHNRGIVHRDLKPQNIFLCKTVEGDEVVKVIDFGISKVLDQSGVTAAGQFIGTPLYMSPEQVRGQSDLIDARADVYALGVVLYEAIAGRPPYQGESIFELVEAINGPDLPPLLAELRPEVPKALDEVLRRAMAKSRDDRPASVTELYNQLANTIRTDTRSEAATPTATIMGTHAVETHYATGMVAAPLWRGRGRASDELRFMAPDGGFHGGDYRTRTLALTGDEREYFGGSVPKYEDIQNDVVLPHRQVSRNAIRVIVRDGRAFLRREPRCNVPVRVGLSMLERGEERPLHHGQAVAVGVVAGMFHDGRFVPSQVPAQAVDEQTGLLGREGLAWEVALAARLGDGQRLVLATPTGDTAAGEAAACQLALAFHDRDPVAPVARFGTYAAAVVAADTDVDDLAAAATEATGTPLLLGHLDIGAASDEAGARIDEARGALARLASSGRDSGVVDLSQHRLNLLDTSRFAAAARELAARGGEIGMLALEDRDKLEQLGPATASALELELLQIAGRVAGPRALFCRPATGAIAFAGPDAAEPVARQVAAEWHSRGPVRGEVLEVERSAAIDVLHPDDLADLPRRAADLASGAGLGAAVESLPLPLAVRVRDAVSAVTPLDRAGALVGVVAATWRFLGITLGNMALAAGKPIDATVDSASGWAEPWRRLASSAAAALAGTPGRVGELAGALFDAGQPRRALAMADEHATAVQAALEGSPDRTGIQRGLTALEGAVTELAGALRPLRGWTLVAVERVDRLGAFGDCESVSYVDYTGTYERGTPRQVTIIKDLRIGPFVYLTRFAEGIVVPLEPHLRRRLCPETGAEELHWAEALVREPGTHRYRTVIHGHLLEDEVNSKQIPRGARR
jgi:hypothetical protein